jgi:hypothetical protein
MLVAVIKIVYFALIDALLGSDILAMGDEHKFVSFVFKDKIGAEIFGIKSCIH